MKTSIKIKIAKYLSKILISFFSSNHITTKRNDIIWKLDLNEAIDLSIFIFGKFEPSIHKIVKKLLVDDSKVKDIIDIGQIVEVTHLILHINFKIREYLPLNLLNIATKN